MGTKRIFLKNHSTEAFNLMEHMVPHIRISPFLPHEWAILIKENTKNRNSTATNPSFWLDHARDLKFFKSGRSALLACLKYEKLKRDDEVLIITTTQGPYISSCVTKTIEKICQWSRDFSKKTRAVLVIHEFGFPCNYSLIKPYIEKGIPIIEDCAYAIGSRIKGASIGTFGDYAIYSLTKYYPIPFGGILVSKKMLPAKTSMSIISKHDALLIKKTINNTKRSYNTWNKIRQSNWEFFVRNLREYRVTPYFPLDSKVVPGVFLAKLPKGFKGDIRKKRLNAAGVEATEYYGQGGFYFPVHQFLTDYEKRYILHHFINAV